MTNEPVSLKIDQGIIRPIIEAKINEGIVEMMGGKEKLIEDMLGAWMTRLVNSDGKTGEYNSKIPRFEYLITQMLNEALKKALNAYLAERQEQITAEFSKYFKSKAGSSQSPSSIEKGACSDGCIHEALDKWYEAKMQERAIEAQPVEEKTVLLAGIQPC